MREYLTSSDIANSISMMRTAFDGTIVVVEGVTDRRLYGKYMDAENTNIIIAHSKDKVKSSVSEVYGRRKDSGVIGILDSDLDLIRKKEPERPLFQTDTRDAESMIIMSPALENVLWEFGSEEKILRFQETMGKTVREALIDAAYPVGLLMYVSHKERINLSFKDIDFRQFIDYRTLECNIDRMVEEVFSCSRCQHINVNIIKSKLRTELSKNYDKTHLCRGHDLVDILVLALRNTFGEYNAKNIREGELGGSLRLAYDSSMFKTTKLYRDTSGWCTDHDLRLWKVTEESDLPS